MVIAHFYWDIEHDHHDKKIMIHAAHRCIENAALVNINQADKAILAAGQISWCPACRETSYATWCICLHSCLIIQDVITMITIFHSLSVLCGVPIIYCDTITYM